MSRGLQRALLFTACLVLGSCASGVQREASPDAPLSADTTVEGGASEPLASDPYVRRPDGLGGPGEEGPRVRFVRPEPLPASGERPRFARPLSVGVVLVHEGVLANPKTLVLELEANLARDEEVRRVVALRGVAGGAASLDDLRELAAKQGHDALLVDVLPGPTGAVREGFWLHPAAKPEASLIAHVIVRDAEAGLVGPPTFPDVWDRLATAHVRLPLPR